jgi:hypothetical protein
VKEKYFSEAEDVRPWPWYIYGRTFFEGVGAEFREIEDRLQMLLGEVVYEVEEFIPCSIRRLYSVGGRAVREFEGVPEFQEVATHHDEPDYLGGARRLFTKFLAGACYDVRKSKKILQAHSFLQLFRKISLVVKP